MDKVGPSTIDSVSVVLQCVVRARACTATEGWTADPAAWLTTGPSVFGWPGSSFKEMELHDVILGKFQNLFS